MTQEPVIEERSIGRNHYINLYLEKIRVAYATLEPIDQRAIDCYRLPQETFGGLFLGMLQVTDSNKRGNRFGSMLVDRVIELSDNSEKLVITRPCPFGREEPRLTYDQLYEFYKRHGFTEYNEDFLIHRPNDNEQF